MAFYQKDVIQWAEIEDIIAQEKDSLGHIDFLFNSAAVYPKVSFLDEAAGDFEKAIKAGRIFNMGSWAEKRLSVWSRLRVVAIQIT